VLDEDDYGGNCSSRQRLLSVFEGQCGAVSLHQCHNEHRLHITLCRAHCLWTRGARMLPFIRLSLQMWFVRANPSFDQSDDPSKEVITFPLVPVQQVLCSSTFIFRVKQSKTILLDPEDEGTTNLRNVSNSSLIYTLSQSTRPEPTAPSLREVLIPQF